MSKFLDKAGLGYVVERLKALFATRQESATIPFGKVDATSTSTAFTATVPNITELKDGVCCYLMNGVATSAKNWTLNVNGLGAKHVYQNLAAASQTSTIFNVNYTMLFVYNSTRVNGGCWDIFYGYNSDNNTIGYDIVDYYTGSKKVKTACQRYQFLLTTMDGLLLPVYSGKYTTATTKTLTTEKFNPFGQIYYYTSTAALTANAIPATGTLRTKSSYSLPYLTYAFNTGATLVAGNDVYLVCVPQDDGSAVLHTNPIAFALPTTEDGLLYKRLGKCSDEDQIILEQDKPVYYYKDGAIRLWTNGKENVHVYHIQTNQMPASYSAGSTLPVSAGELLDDIQNGIQSIIKYDVVYNGIVVVSYNYEFQIAIADSEYYQAAFMVTSGVYQTAFVLKIPFERSDSDVEILQHENTSIATLASPEFTGTPTAPTATAGTNTTQIATTEFVVREVEEGTVTIRNDIDSVNNRIGAIESILNDSSDDGQSAQNTHVYTINQAPISVLVQSSSLAVTTIPVSYDDIVADLNNRIVPVVLNDAYGAHGYYEQWTVSYVRTPIVSVPEIKLTYVADTSIYTITCGVSSGNLVINSVTYCNLSSLSTTYGSSTPPPPTP